MKKIYQQFNLKNIKIQGTKFRFSIFVENLDYENTENKMEKPSCFERY